MPSAPLPDHLAEWLAAPRPCVLATVRPDGSPVTVACWYEYSDGRVTLSMAPDAKRVAHIHQNPNVALTILGDDWYQHLSLLGRVVELQDDPDLTTLDRISNHYLGIPYPDREPCRTAVVEIDRWHTYGSPASERAPT